MGVTSIRLNAEVEAPLEELAKKLDRSKNYIINQAVKDYIERQLMGEARWLDTQVALASLKAGHAVSGEKVAAWLASWGSGAEGEPPQ